jgi:formate hydrogenlyase transcriptional activator
LRKSQRPSESIQSQGQAAKEVYMAAVATVYRMDHEQKERRFEEIIGDSPALEQVLEQVELVAPTDASVLILGETGTGKELIARAVHSASTRYRRPFIKLNCAAIPCDLLESELFGHEKGAFTGAITQRLGRFEMADKGTIFLDEIGDIPLALQPKLLRVLQEREFERVGNCRTQKVDVRVVAATHRDLGEMVRKNEFRSDLYYRLNVFPLRLPPLRERREDIPPLVRHFVELFSKRMGKVLHHIPAETLCALTSYSWPGNIRELRNVIERAVVLSKGPVLTAHIAELDITNSEKCSQPDQQSLDDMLHEAERSQILRALELADGVVAGPNGAAARLRIKRSTLMSRMQRLGIHMSRNFSASHYAEANWGAS